MVRKLWISLSDPILSLKYKFNDFDVNYITSSFMIDKLSITWTQRDQGHYMFNMELSPACFLTYCPAERLVLPGKVNSLIAGAFYVSNCSIDESGTPDKHSKRQAGCWPKDYCLIETFKFYFYSPYKANLNANPIIPPVAGSQGPPP